MGSSKIRDRRLERGFTLKALSALTGIGISDLSQIERGIRGPVFPGWRRRISVALKVPERELFTRERSQRWGRGR